MIFSASRSSPACAILQRTFLASWFYKRRLSSRFETSPCFLLAVGQDISGIGGMKLSACNTSVGVALYAPATTHIDVRWSYESITIISSPRKKKEANEFVHIRGNDASLFLNYSLGPIQASSCPFRIRPKASYKNTEKDARDTMPRPSTHLSTSIDAFRSQFRYLIHMPNPKTIAPRRISNAHVVIIGLVLAVDFFFQGKPW